VTIERPNDHGSSRAPSPVAPPPQTSTRSGRSVRFPRRFDDFLPGMRTAALAHIPSKDNQNPPQVIESEDPMSHPASQADSNPATGADGESQSHVASDESPAPINAPETLTTNLDSFGVYRVYSRKPLHDPLQCNGSNINYDTHTPDPAETRSDCQMRTAPNQGPPHPEKQIKPYFHPFSNLSAAAMMVAHHLGTPLQSLQQTTQNARILGSLGSDLNPLDLINFDAARENKKLDAYLASTSESTFRREDGWVESSVRIRMPLDKTKMAESDAAEHEVAGVFHRDLVDVITSVYQSDAVRSFDHIPFKQFWKPSEDGPPERLYGEIFTSDVLLDADKDICTCVPSLEDPPELEAISVPLLLYSDSTHLANFGTASCWPVYMFFGSESKYVRATPTSSACHHIAYMPSVRCIRISFSIC
jgi:Plavaka transposase